jgi:acetyl-CoA C-acetyltransferase
MSREIVIVSAVCGPPLALLEEALKDIAADRAGRTGCARITQTRAGVDGDDVGHVVFGHVVNTEPKDMYLSRVAAINGGCGEGTPAFNVNRLCGSGLQAIVSAGPGHRCWGTADIAIGGGAENMSRGAVCQPEHAAGARAWVTPR